MYCVPGDGEEGEVPGGGGGGGGAGRNYYFRGKLLLHFFPCGVIVLVHRTFKQQGHLNFAFRGDPLRYRKKKVVEGGGFRELTDDKEMPSDKQKLITSTSVRAPTTGTVTSNQQPNQSRPNLSARKQHPSQIFLAVPRYDVYIVTCMYLKFQSIFKIAHQDTITEVSLRVHAFMARLVRVRGGRQRRDTQHDVVMQSPSPHYTDGPALHWRFKVFFMLQECQECRLDQAASEEASQPAQVCFHA